LQLKYIKSSTIDVLGELGLVLGLGLRLDLGFVVAFSF